MELEENMGYFDVFVWITKGVQFFQAAKDINDTCRDENLSTTQKATRIGADSLFMVAQAAEIGAGAKEKSSDKLKFGTRIAAGTTDVVRQIAQEGLGVDTLCTIAYRAADVADGSIETGYSDKEKLEKYIDALKAAGTILSNRVLLGNTAEVACSFTKNMVRDIRNKLKSNPEFVKAKNSADIPKLSEDDKAFLKKQVKELEDLANFSNLKNIPKSLSTDPVLKNYICPITKRPIREVMTLDDDRDEIPIIYFEKDAIADWIRNKPETAPPSWPTELLSLPIKNPDLRVCRHAQYAIEARLKEIGKDAEIELENLIEDFPFLVKM